jgi:hypothetical protein
MPIMSIFYQTMSCWVLFFCANMYSQAILVHISASNPSLESTFHSTYAFNTMKTTLVSILIACLPVALWAQSKPTYQPGKWYVGARAEGYNLERKGRSRGIASESQGICLLVGRRLSSHVDLQLGLMLASQPSGYNGALVEDVSTTPRITNRSYIGRALYAPLTVKYTPLGTQRRWQPYLNAGLTTLAGTMRLRERDADFTVESVSESTQLSVNWLVGVGLQVRTVKRVHLFLEFDLLKPVYQGGQGASLSAGLVYDFASR